jgi:bacillolysin
MNARVRAACVVVACLLLSLTLSAAAPIPRGGAGGSVGGPSAVSVGGPSVVSVGRPDPSASSQPVVVPAVGAVAPGIALRELSAGDDQPMVNFDAVGNVVGMAAPPGATIANPEGGGTDGFVRRYAGAFGLNSSYTAIRADSHVLPGGDTVTRYQQASGGVPVLGGEIVVTADAQGGVKGVVAEATQATPTATTAVVSAGDAGRVGLEAAASRFSLDAASLTVGGAELWLYDPALIGAPGAGGARPTWLVEILGPTGGKASTVLVDATDASVALALNARREGTDRTVCDLNGVEDTREFDLDDVNVYACNDYSALGAKATTRREGGAASTVAEVNRAYDSLGVAHGFFASTYGIDSYDGHGGQIRATVRACQKDIVVPPGMVFDFYCPFPNAFWDGYQFVFGEGYAVDDVTAHEFTHAVIDHASQLFYAYQSGAINESIADILGEFADQSYTAPGEDTTKLWLIGEDLPPHPADGIRELRDMQNPGRLGQAASFRDDVYYYGDDDNGGVHTNSGVGNRFAYLVAAGWPGVPGLGLAKSKMLWYRVMHLMPSGGDYQTLGWVVEQACVELVGHNGFTADDCFNTVGQARSFTGLFQPRRYNNCSAGTPDPPAFFDDFEGEHRWVLTPGWNYLPSPAVPVRFAMSGTHSLYGYAPLSGPIAYATTIDPITVPAIAGSPLLTFRMRNPSGGFADGGAIIPLWEYDDVNDGAGWQGLGGMALNNNITADHVIPLSAIAGKTVLLRTSLRSAEDWVIDDIGINSCSVRFTGSAFDVSSVWSGTSAVLSWKYDSTPYLNIGLSYDPPIPGAPTFLPGADTDQYGVPQSVTLNGLDPATTYRVTITIVDTFSGQNGPPTLFMLSAQPSDLCLTSPPLPFPIATQTKPDPTCGGILVPRRTG